MALRLEDCAKVGLGIGEDVFVYEDKQGLRDVKIVSGAQQSTHH